MKAYLNKNIFVNLAFLFIRLTGRVNYSLHVVLEVLLYVVECY